MMWSAADRLRDDMNDTHDAWIQDSVQHQMVCSPINPLISLSVQLLTTTTAY
jgi:hypothetical protein